MGFAENLFRLRAAHNMTQEQLAMLMGVSRQAISKWESARAYPEMDKLVRLCDTFGCDLNELVRGDVADMSARPELAVPVDAEPVDICGYDRCMRSRAFMLATAAAVLLLALAILFGTSSAVIYREASMGWVFVPPDLLLRSSPIGLPALVLGILISLVLVSVTLNRYLGFRGRFPYVEDFYMDEQREQTRVLVRRARVVAGIAEVVGIVACLVKSGPLCHVSGGLTSLCAWGAVAVWSLVYAGLMDIRLDIARYNERNAATLEQREAAVAYAALPATRALVAANPKVPQLARMWVRRQAAVAAVLVWIYLPLTR